MKCTGIAPKKKRRDTSTFQSGIESVGNPGNTGTGAEGSGGAPGIFIGGGGLSERG